MNITVNNKPVETAARTLADLIAEMRLPAVGVAAAVNNKMVPRTAWAAHLLEEGQQVTIIKAACGG